MRRHVHHKHHQQPHKPKKKKLSPFYGSLASVAIIAFIAIFYFVVLVSTKPRSILLVTQKIESSLQEKFGADNVSIDRTHLSFTNYGTLKITISGLRILYPTTDGGGKKSFIIPILDTEFCLFDFLLLRFQPNKVKLSNPNIFLDDWHKTAEKTDKQNDLSLITSLLASIRKGDNPIENLEVENAKLIIRGENFQRDILLKKSLIKITNKSGNLTIASQNQLNFDEKNADLNLSSNCQISSSNNIICDLSLQNLCPDTVAELHPDLKLLGNINSALSTNISFALQDNEFRDIKFKIHAEQGDFDFTDFFTEKMHFSNFAISGSYDHQAKILDLAQIETDFIDDKNPTNKPHLAMSLKISQLEENKKFDFAIALKNVLVDEIEKFWPITLNQNDIRNWVSTHTKDGIISDASTKFSLTQNGQEMVLDDINATLNLSALTLKYDDEFPEIKNVTATANFTYKGMKIAISSGEVLQSKITDGLVEIDDFDAKNVILKISGKSTGHASNGLQHANNHPEFMSEVAKYLNGDSQNNFDIRIPLSTPITLKNSYITVNSSITNLSNDYIHGDISLTSKKNIGSTDFVTNFNLTNAEIGADSFNLHKKSGVNSQLSLAVAVKDSKHLQIKNILLTSDKENEKVSGNISFATAPFLVESVNFKNNNFGGNNYSIAYQANSSSQKVIVSGDKISLVPLLKSKSNNKSKSNLTIQIAANRVQILNNKWLRNFYLSLQCSNDLCLRGLLKANYNKQESINLKIEHAAGNNVINGRISDIGYLAEGLGISKVISGGDAKVKIEHFLVDKKPVFKGMLTINDNITIYEDEAVKRFAKDTLFSQVRDKIFSSEKTTFDSVKVDFYLKNSLLDIRSLVANNYKIGITAKGSINLANNDTHLKGMIIPGYIVNSLFGIGNIPLVGGVISGLLTGGEGGGLFGIRYEYDKNPTDKEATFSTNKVTAFVPSTIQNLFE